MEAQIEALVELYLTRGGTVFISPQYDLAWSKTEKDGGSCPDFVALDMVKKEVLVVEVTSAASKSVIHSRVKNREANWFKPLWRKQMMMTL
jgi:hypothetical protein